MVALRESKRCIILVHCSPLSIIVTELGWEFVFVGLSVITQCSLAIKARPPPHSRLRA